MPGITLEGGAAIQVIGAALPKLAERGLIGADDFPLMRQLYDVVGRDESLQMPWTAFFGGEGRPSLSAPAACSGKTRDSRNHPRRGCVRRSTAG